MKRIFIDSDVIQDDEVGTAEYTIEIAKGIQGDFTFDQVVGFAWHDGVPAWEAVKSADEIYANTSLVPLCGYGSYTGSVVVMDVMMEKAIAENITGKSIYFLRPFKDIDWEGIDMELVDKAFRKNYLYTLESDYKFEQVDIDSLIRKFK